MKSLLMLFMVLPVDPAMHRKIAHDWQFSWATQVLILEGWMLPMQGTGTSCHLSYVSCWSQLSTSCVEFHILVKFIKAHLSSEQGSAHGHVAILFIMQCHVGSKVSKAEWFILISFQHHLSKHCRSITQPKASMCSNRHGCFNQKNTCSSSDTADPAQLFSLRLLQCFKVRDFQEFWRSFSLISSLAQELKYYGPCIKRLTVLLL